jgi:hypothetical protein
MWWTKIARELLKEGKARTEEAKKGRSDDKMTELATNERALRSEIPGSSQQGRREAVHWVQERVQRLPFRLGARTRDAARGPGIGSEGGGPQ